MAKQQVIESYFPLESIHWLSSVKHCLLLLVLRALRNSIMRYIAVGDPFFMKLIFNGLKLSPKFLSSLLLKTLSNP